MKPIMQWQWQTVASIVVGIIVILLLLYVVAWR